MTSNIIFPVGSNFAIVSTLKLIRLLWEIEIIYSVIEINFPNVFLLCLCFSTLFYICASTAEYNFTANIWGHSFMMSRKNVKNLAPLSPIPNHLTLVWSLPLDIFNWHLISLAGNGVLGFFSKNLNNDINTLTNNFFLC